MADAFDLLDDAVTTDKGSITDYTASRGELFGAGFQESFEAYNPTALLGRQMRYLDEDLNSLTGQSERVDQKTAQAEIAKRGLDLKVPVGGMTRHELDMLQYLKQRELARQQTYARPRPIGGTASLLTGALAGSAVDPINVASAFIPIVPEARYAQWLARAGEGAFARAGVRAGAGAIEGAAGAAIIEPIVYAGATSEQADYGLMDSFMNVTLGGVLGGGLHSIGGAIYDRAAGSKLPPPEVLDVAAPAPDHVKRDALQEMVAAHEQGDIGDVEHIFHAWHGSPHTFEKFDITKIGKGEGGQAFGHGLYFAQSPTVAENYRRDLAVVSAADVRSQGDAVAWLRGGRKGEVGDRAMKDIAAAEEDFLYFEKRKASDEELAKYLEDGVEAGQGAVYKVAIKAHPERLLDWDAPLSEQSAFVKRALRDAGYIAPGMDIDKSAMLGKEIVNNADPQQLAADLRAQGVKGIQYFDAVSRQEGAGTRNFVVFDDKDVNIVSRNGERIGPRGLSDLIPEARADRTEDAFTRQFVEDGRAPAPKPEPKDDIARAKADEAYSNELVDEFRSEGRLTEEDEAGLKAIGDAVKRAELKAKTYEAAAACLGVA